MQETSAGKLQRGKPFTEDTLTRKMKDLLHPALMRIAKSAVTFRIVKDNGYSPLPGRPVIFVANHYCGQDVVIACNAIGHRVQVVAGKQPLLGADEFFFNANGTIFVDRKDKTDTAACKRAMEAHLKNGQDVLIFPEGTSNVSDALLMYPMKWSVIEAAQNSGAQLIPMVLDYDKEKKECHVHFCEPLVADGMEKAAGIALLRDTMASVRWDYMEQKSLLHRADADIAELRRQNMELLLSYKLLDYAYERSVVFCPWVTEEEAFAPIHRLRDLPKRG